MRPERSLYSLYSWVVAAEPSLPWEEGIFLEAYADNRCDANALVLESSPVAAELQKFMKYKPTTWSGSCTALLEGLEGQAEEKTKKLKSWPKTARGLSSALRRLAPNLRAVGIDVQFGREGHGRQRTVYGRPRAGPSLGPGRSTWVQGVVATPRD